MFSYVPKQAPGSDPESIITPKSVISAVIICLIAGLGFPYCNYVVGSKQHRGLYAYSLKINNENKYVLKYTTGKISFSITSNGENWLITGEFDGKTHPECNDKLLLLTKNDDPIELVPMEPPNGNKRYVLWTCHKFEIEKNDILELIFEKDFIKGSEYMRCRLAC